MMSGSYLQSINPGEGGCLLSSDSRSSPSCLVLCSEISRGHTPEGKGTEVLKPVLIGALIILKWGLSVRYVSKDVMN